jgi:uncharacterized membrane protein
VAPDVGGSNPLTHPKILPDGTSAGTTGVLALVATTLTVRRVTLQVVLTTAIFAVLDFVWLGVLMNEFYKTELGPLARLSGSNFAPVWWAAFAVYGVLVTGIVVFVLPRAEGQPRRALGFGALMGVVTYGTYDFTAYSVLAGWSLRMTLVDIAWGAVICGTSAALVTLLEPKPPKAPASHTPAPQSLA